MLTTEAAREKRKGIDLGRRLAKVARVEDMTGLERTTIKRLQKRPRNAFPTEAGFVGEHRVWYEDEIVGWLKIELARSPEERRSSKKRPPESDTTAPQGASAL